MRSYLSTYIPRLSPRVWRVLGADAVSALGTGFVLPFLMVYLRDVRDIDVTTAGLVVAVIAVVSLVVAPGIGSLVDRVGPRRTLIVALCICAAGSVTTAFIRETWHAFLAAGLMGAGFAAMWPATHSLLTSIVEPHQRSSVYAVHYATLNAGIGLGGIAGGLIADVNDPRSFELLYSFDALSWLFFAVVLFFMRDIGGRVEHEVSSDGPGGYAEVLKDRTFLRLMAIAALLVTVGYSQLQSGFPAYATDEGGASTRVLGAAFAANTFLIVVLQLVVLRWLEGKRRTRALMAICVLWAIAWVLTIAAGVVGPGLMANLGFVLALVFIAAGECLVSPSIPGMLNDLAPDHLRGRYNAGYSLMFSVGHIIGPAVAGVMLGRNLGEALFVGLIAACGVTLLMARSLERSIPEAANLVSGEQPSPPVPEAEQAVV
ncbi:MAG: MFS transporter [Actinomycetota bacterium]